MAAAPEPEKLALVKTAIALHGCRYCFEWVGSAAERIRCDRYMRGLTPEVIRQLVVEHVVTNQQPVIQVAETREGFEFPHYYKVVVPHQLFRAGLFVEMRLVGEDPDVPMVRIVNAHEQGK